MVYSYSGDHNLRVHVNMIGFDNACTALTLVARTIIMHDLQKFTWDRPQNVVYLFHFNVTYEMI